VISITGASRVGEMILMVSPTGQHNHPLETDQEALTPFDVGVDPAFLEVDHSPSSPRYSHHESLQHQHRGGCHI
jgi:hypothetical protein